MTNPRIFVLLALLPLAACQIDDATAARAFPSRASLFAAPACDSAHARGQLADLATLAAFRVNQQPQSVRQALQRLRDRETPRLSCDVVAPPPPTDTTTTPPPDSEPPPPPPQSCGVTDWNTRAKPALGKPGYLQPVTEPTFGTRLVRVAGDPGTPIGNGVAGNWPSSAARHHYSKSQAWSADGRLLVLYEMSGAVGAGWQLFLDGDTYQPLFARSHPGYEARWHPTLADVQVYVDGVSGSVGHWNPRTNARTVKFATTAYRTAHFGNYEGHPSFDGRYVAVNATRNSDGRAVVYVVDVDAGTKGPDIDLAAQGVTDLDWAGVSASGQYVVLLGRVNGVSQAAKVLTRAGAPVRTWTDFRIGHADLGFDAAGNDVLFSAAASGTYAKRFFARRLDTGTITTLSPPISYDWHVSAKNARRPGWGYANTSDNTGSALDGQVYALRMDGGAVERYAFHRSTSSTYNAQPQASPAPDGRRVIFASDWGVAGGPVQAYVVGCP